jgi:hypothetical protein
MMGLEFLKEVYRNDGCHEFRMYVLFKFVSADTVEPYKNEVFFEHPEVPEVNVYVGSIEGDVATLISENPVDPSKFPNAKRIPMGVIVKVSGKIM